METRHEVVTFPGIPNGDSPPVLKLVKGLFNQVPLLTQFAIILSRSLAVDLGGMTATSLCR